MAYSEPIYKHVPTMFGNVMRSAEMTCFSDPGIFIETGVAAALKAWGTVVEPDEKEAFRKLFGRSFVCSLKSEIRAASELAGFDESGARRFLFQAAEFVDMAVWYYFLADVVFEGLLSWYSTARRAQGCNDPHNPNAGVGTGYVGALADNGVWQSMDYSFNPPSKFQPVSPSQVIVRAGHNYTCTASVRFQDSMGLEVGTNAQVISSASGLILDQFSTPSMGDGANHITHVWSQGKNPENVLTFIAAESSYTGIPLPLHECFPVQESMRCYLYSPDP